MNEEKNVLIIPDVHGRSFWKEAVEQYWEKCSKIVFLGDYTDPYPSEDITRRSALEQLLQIIDLKQSDPQRVVLLLGNHDLHYMYREFVRGSRYSASHAHRLKEVFLSHSSLFQLAHEEELYGTRFLFTHAGVLPLWYQAHREDIESLCAESLNRLNTPYHRQHMLSEVSYLRGGMENYGSFLWGDMCEWDDDSCIDGIYQVFGHTQLEEPKITVHWACLDCRQAILLHYDQSNCNDRACSHFFIPINSSI